MRLHNFALLSLAVPSLGACSMLDGVLTKDKPPLEGKRVSILDLQQTLTPDAPAPQDVALGLPAPWRNDFWPQVGGYPNHVMQHLALPAKLNQAWQEDVGKGGDDDYPLTCQPLVVDGVVYALDSESVLSAFAAANGKPLWQTPLQTDEDDERVITGGIGFGENRLFATTGNRELVSINYKNGKILWRAPLPAPARAAPTVLGGRVFVTTLDNRLLALSAPDGKQIWEYQGLSEMTSVLGAANAAATSDVIIAVFSSGEITALQVENGSVAWTDNLAGIRPLGGLASLSVIRALPVVERGLVLAVSYGGRMAAIDERTGTRIWQRDIGGLNTPWVAGDYVYVLSLDQDLIALSLRDGRVLWVTALPKFEDEKDREDPLRWYGPVLAGGRLIVASSDGRVTESHPQSGAILNTWQAGDSFSMAPVVAGESLYLYDNSGVVHAYR